jgi:peptidoglycan/xylan/chitin deacetylase (PgdA/CDA1 family)
MRLYKYNINLYKIFNGHNITKNDSIDIFGNDCTEEILELFIRKCLLDCEFISLEDLIDAKINNLKGRYLSLTFDDGHHGSFENGLSLINSYGIKPCFFLLTDEYRVNDKYLFWWDTLKFVFNEFETSQSDIFEVRSFLNETLLITGEEKRFGFNGFINFYKDDWKELFVWLYFELKNKSLTGRKHIIDKLLENFKIESKLNELQNFKRIRIHDHLNFSGNFDIASHGNSHLNYRISPMEEKKSDIETSLKKIRSLNSNKLMYFSIPHGGLNDFTNSDAKLIIENGYQQVFSMHKSDIVQESYIIHSRNNLPTNLENLINLNLTD